MSKSNGYNDPDSARRQLNTHGANERLIIIFDSGIVGRKTVFFLYLFLHQFLSARFRPKYFSIIFR